MEQKIAILLHEINKKLQFYYPIQLFGHTKLTQNKFHNKWKQFSSTLGVNTSRMYIVVYLTCLLNGGGA